MLHLIAGRLVPAPLHRYLLRHAHRIRVVWWRWAKPRLIDCRVIALDGEGQVLLVRHSYGSGAWMPPGGRPNRGEDPVAAGMRELREEAGCGLADAVEVSRPDVTGRQVRFTVVGRAIGTPKVDAREIVEARFFAPDSLPEPVGSHLQGQLARWIARYHEGLLDARTGAAR